MSGRDSAARYARALLEVASAEDDPRQVGAGLTAFAALVSGHDELRAVFANPAVPADGKNRIVVDLAQRLGLRPSVTKILQMLADQDRLPLIPDLAVVYGERLMEHEHVVRAAVTTASPLAQDHLDRLQQRLAHATGRQVTMTASVDPSLIGGMVARIGDTVYDGTVATQLAKLREKLLQET
jgi:F-type H+-transporting ATPase subunit delta